MLLHLVHERDEEMEFLLIVVKILLIENSPHTKVILMSATFETEEFAKYFRLPILNVMEDAPTIDLILKRQYKIREFYLDDLESLSSKALINFEKPGIDATIYNLAIVLITMFERWDRTSDAEANPPAILVFLPGINELQEMHRKLNAHSAK